MLWLAAGRSRGCVGVVYYAKGDRGGGEGGGQRKPNPLFSPCPTFKSRRRGWELKEEEEEEEEEKGWKGEVVLG